MKILVADDDIIARTLVHRVVSDAGHDVTAVADGEAAWTTFQGGGYELVLLDWLMPGLNGLEVCKNIRASQWSDGTFIIMITGRDTTADLRGALECGVDDYIVKPVAADLLSARLVIAAKHLQESNERRRTREALERAQRLAAIGETSAALQHEINNPLGALMANVQLALMTENPHEIRESLKVIGEQAKRIADVVKRLQRLSTPRSVEYLPGSRMLDLSGDDSRHQ